MPNISDIKVSEFLTMLGTGSATAFIMYLLYTFVMNHFEHIKTIECKIDKIPESFANFKDQLNLKYETSMTALGNEIKGYLTTVNGTLSNLAVSVQVILDRYNRDDDDMDDTDRPHRKRK